MMYDYACHSCVATFERNVPYHRRDEQRCECGAAAVRVWLTAPGVMGEENVSQDELKAARSGFIRGGGSRHIPPFTGSTRSELHAWYRENNLVSIPKSDVKSRNVTINTKQKFTETPEFKRVQDQAMRHALEVSRCGDEAVNKEFERIEKVNDFDKKAFAQQVAAGVAATAAEANVKSAISEVGAEVAGG